MSKIGQKPVIIPSSVQIMLEESKITVKGSKGELVVHFPSDKITVKHEQDQLVIIRAGENRRVKALHGLYRSIIANAVHGVDKSWEKRLEVVGTGYNVKPQGQDVVFKVGYSHPVIFKQINGIQFKVEGNNKVVVSGVDRQLVGQIAYQIKMIKKPDAYKGKGIRYEGEVIKLKPGKKAKA